MCAYTIAASLGWRAHLENPQGVLLYTPPANSTQPNYTPAFYVAFTITITLIFIISAATSLLSFVLRFIFNSEKAIMLTKKLALSAAIIAGATLLGVIACAMYP
jgi:hypothetical protein